MNKYCEPGAIFLNWISACISCGCFCILNWRLLVNSKDISLRDRYAFTGNRDKADFASCEKILSFPFSFWIMPISSVTYW